MPDLTPNTQLYNDYLSRINQVIDYIDRHLASEMSLEELAAVANFSKYHFHRVFYAFMQETLFQYIQRLRLERAASLLCIERRLSITEIAYICGFTNSSAFARAFKGYCGMSATEWRKRQNANSNMSTMDSNMDQAARNGGKAMLSPSRYDKDIKSDEVSAMTRSIEGKVEVKNLSEMTVAYIRYVGPYQGNAELFENLFNRLFTWAGARDLVKFPETETLVIYHDNPDITDDSKLRMSVCITVPADTPVDGEIGKMQLPGGKYALARFQLTTAQYGEAWDWVYGVWLPQSGFVPDDRPCFEMYPMEGECQSSEGPMLVDICVPVKPL